MKILKTEPKALTAAAILVAARKRLVAGFEDIIRQFFAANPNPTDPMVHELALSLGLTPEALEAEIYRLFTECNDRAMGSWCQARGCTGVRATGKGIPLQTLEDAARRARAAEADTTMVPQRQRPMTGALARLRRTHAQ